MFPPWMTKPGTTRLKLVPSKSPVAVRFKKLRTDSGACSGYNSSSIKPDSVSSETHCVAIVFTSALSNGSAGGALGVGVGRALTFGGVDPAACANAIEPNAEIRINAARNLSDMEFIFGQPTKCVKEERGQARLPNLRMCARLDITSSLERNRSTDRIRKLGRRACPRSSEMRMVRCGDLIHLL